MRTGHGEPGPPGGPGGGPGVALRRPEAGGVRHGNFPGAFTGPNGPLFTGRGCAQATAPELLGLYGVGVDTAATLLIAAGDNAERRLAEGRNKADIIRILKRYVAREVYHYLPRS
jgi:hypothetical protein